MKSMHRDKSAKMAIWQKIAILPFWHFCPCASISKFSFATILKRFSIVLNQKSFGQNNYELGLCLRNKITKMANFLPNCHFGTFVPVYRFKNFFLQNDFWLSVMKELLHTFAEKVSQALSRPVHVLISEDKLNYFKFPLADFKNSFCFG